MHLKYPLLNGGSVQGLNDAGVETFAGKIEERTGKECGQNTGDAPGKGQSCVTLTFSRSEISREDVPCIDELRHTLESCLIRWNHNEKERKFFERAIATASESKLSMLRISDYGTTGLTGEDLDEKGRWFALVKSQGVSNKGNTEGGSFGIGKSSPFAASAFRTVIYSTKTEAGTVAFQGVSRLATHLDDDGKETQGVGFIGDYDETGGQGGSPLFRAIRDEQKIPDLFRRKEAGTDIWILGYLTGEEWRENLVSSILENFWPAIHFGKIKFNVGDVSIKQETLEALIEEYSKEEDFEAHHFFEAVKNKPVRKNLSLVGDCELYLASSNPELPKKVCMSRAAGMRIQDYRPRSCRIPFSGLFICKDKEGNKLLREMEPPRHDEWDPSRIADDTGKKALAEIRAWIRDEVKKLNPLHESDQFNESEAAKYLNDSSDDNDGNTPEDLSGDETGEDLDPIPRDENLLGKPVKAKPLVKSADDTSSSGGGGGGGGGGGDGGGGDEEGDRRGGRNETALPNVEVRSYCTGPTGSYRLVLRSKTKYSGDISLRAVGDDGRSETVGIKSVTMADDKAVSYSIDGNVIKNIKIPKNKPLRLDTTLIELTRRSLSAKAVK